MKTDRYYTYLLLLMILAGLTKCYPVETDITYEDVDIALTEYDKDYYLPGEYNHFMDFQTFIIPDTVVHILEEGVPDEISRDYDEFVLEQVRSNMLKLGFMEEHDPEVNAPDLTVTVSVTTSEDIVYNWYPYWAWFFIFVKKSAEAKGSDVGNNYPWYPYYGWNSTYTYTSGTVIMEMDDNSKVDQTSEEIPQMWAGLINGAVGGPPEDIKSRISKGIDQCFNQSPYLFK